MSAQIPVVLTDRDVLQAKIAEASEALYQVAKSAYGPKAGNVMLGFKHGAPLLSRDGVTNIKLVRLADPVADDAAQAIKQVSEKNNQKVGDGTTAVVILTHHLLKAAQRLEGKGLNPMEIAAKLKEAEAVAHTYIDSIKKPVVDDEFLEKVATISAGDPELGAMIADIMKEVGKDGGVMIEQYEGLGVHNELIDGFYFHRGYKDTDLINDPTANQSNHYNVPILISNKVMNTEVDIAPVLNAAVKAGIKELIIVGEVNHAAIETLKMTRAKGLMMAVAIDPPYVVGGRSLFLDDIAVMTGGEIYNGVDFNVEQHLGFAKEVLVTEHSTTILEGDGEADLIKKRIEDLHGQLKEAEHPTTIQFIKDRLARLTNKMAIIRVGGAIEFERDEVRLRVQDAVCAVQSAMKDGILPGGGTTLARITGTDFDDAFRQPFRQLVANAGLNQDAYLAKLEDSKVWEGFNLRNMTDKPIDMLEAGVIDPSLVISEVVTNAVAIVSGLITASAAIAHPVKD
jgi:chaperonin GroEL